MGNCKVKEGADCYYCPACGCEAEPIGKVAVAAKKAGIEWTYTPPTVEGYYWFIDRMYADEQPRIEYVRDYAGKMAIGNWWFGANCEENPTRYMWAGPLPNCPSVPKRFFKLTKKENNIAETQYFSGTNVFAEMYRILAVMMRENGHDDKDTYKRWWKAMHSGGAQKFEYNIDPVTSITVQEIAEAVYKYNVSAEELS